MTRLAWAVRAGSSMKSWSGNAASDRSIRRADWTRSERRPATRRCWSGGTSAARTTARAPATTTARARLRRAPTLRSGHSIGGSALEAVADAPHGLDQLVLVRVGLELLAVMPDVDVDRARL